MPVYQVALADTAKADAYCIYGWVAERAPLRGPAWFEALLDALYSLEHQPYRCPLAREAGKTKRDIRCLIFGRRHGTYRILYEVDPHHNTVWILHVRHGALEDLDIAELAEIPHDH